MKGPVPVPVASLLAEDLAEARSSIGKRPLDPSAERNALDTVRSIRQRLALGQGDSGGVGGSKEGIQKDTGDGPNGSGDAKRHPDASSGVKGDAGAGENKRKLEINNADLAEFLRSKKPKGDPRGWARVLYRAQTRRQGTHAAGNDGKPGA